MIEISKSKVAVVGALFGGLILSGCSGSESVPIPDRTSSSSLQLVMGIAMRTDSEQAWSVTDVAAG